MVPPFLLCIGFVLLVYVVTDSRRQLLWTAAVRELWSGNCNMACRASQRGLPQAFPDSETTGLALGQTPGQIPGQTLALGQAVERVFDSSCVCDTCPCLLLENVMKICEPAIASYNQALRDLIPRTGSPDAHGIAQIYELLLEILATDTTQPQVARIGIFNSCENFTFIKPEQRKRPANKSVSISDEERDTKKQPSTSFRRRSPPPPELQPDDSLLTLHAPPPAAAVPPAEAKPPHSLLKPPSAPPFPPEPEPLAPPLLPTSQTGESSKPVESQTSSSSSQKAGLQTDSRSLEMSRATLQRHIDHGPPPSQPKYVCPKCKAAGVTCMRGCPHENRKVDN
ncbi:uncharacterized protein LOC142976799 [Anticarsia gemmatalis]|uniref:uncharacterized protein LOC142976799 n=1 Tax=Anticarsia gemmatalis TaxID=129554 RepID=UPI003F760D64